MPEHLLRQRQAQRHQEDRPVNRMETDDILSDQMKVRGPQLPELLCAVPVRVISDPRDIVGQRVQPHVGHMLRVKVNRAAPLK